MASFVCVAITDVPHFVVNKEAYFVAADFCDTIISLSLMLLPDAHVHSLVLFHAPVAVRLFRAGVHNNLRTSKAIYSFIYNVCTM